MDRIAKRYVISGIIGLASMLLALAIVLYKAKEKVSRADRAVRPTVSADAGKPTKPPALPSSTPR